MCGCQEFGPDIKPGCDHAMVAGARSCGCDACGVICEGLFLGCREVWIRGPQPIVIRPATFAEPPRSDESAALDGTLSSGLENWESSMERSMQVDGHPHGQRYGDLYSDVIAQIRAATTSLADRLDDLSCRLDLLESSSPGLQE